MMTPLTKKIQAAVLALAIMAPAESAFAITRHHRKTTRTTTTHRRPHHYSQTRGAVIGAVAGALVDRRHPLTGALIGGALGEGVQYERNVHERHKVKH